MNYTVCSYPAMTWRSRELTNSFNATGVPSSLSMSLCVCTRKATVVFVAQSPPMTPRPICSLSICVVDYRPWHGIETNEVLEAPAVAFRSN